MEPGVLKINSPSGINAVQMSGMSSLLPASPSPHPALPPLTPFSPPPSLTCCPELDLSVTVSPGPKTDHLRPTEPSQRRNQSQVCFNEAVTVTATTEPHVTSRRTMVGLKKRGSKSGVLKHNPPPSAATSNPACLERAEPNTMLHLEAKLQSLQGEEFNPQRAVEQALQKEQRTKNLINTRVSEGVNIPRGQLLFTSLVSTDVEEEELISQVMQDKLLLALPPRCHDSRDAVAPLLPPFTTPHLLRQKPLPTEEEPPRCQPCPAPRPDHTVFDLYRRHACWEATP